MTINGIKITAEMIADMETIWFCADLHHGHPKIVNICNRPIYLSDELNEMFRLKEKDSEGYRMEKDPLWKAEINKLHDEWLVREVINKWVQKKHELYLVGDVSLAKRKEAEKFLDRLNGNKFLILGNHDKNIHNSTRFNQITQIKDFSYSRFGLNIHIALCHYPLASWNRKPHGAWHLYGHVHGRFKNDGLSFDVGIDNWELLEFTGGVYRPINLYEVCQIMTKKQKT